LTFLTDYE